MSVILPPSLRDNARIGLICPAGGFENYRPIKSTVEYLKKLGFKVRIGNHIISNSSSYKYLSSIDENRIKDFIDFWNDDSIDAIFCLRGGYGSLKLLEKIDFAKLVRRNKIFIGYSDITVLLLALYFKLNLVTFHGPMLGIDFFKTTSSSVNKFSERNLWKILRENQFLFSYSYRSSIVISPGRANGVLLGGNLSCIASMIGSAFLPSFKNSILFLEDCNEDMYRIDRYLTQLKNAGIFNNLKGLIFSNFQNCKFTKEQFVRLVKDILKKDKFPILYGFPIGHCSSNLTLPLGLKVTLDANLRTLIRE